MKPNPQDLNAVWMARVTLLIVCWLATSVALAQSGVKNEAAVCAARNRSDSAKVSGFTFITYQSEDGACLQATQSGKVIFQRTMDAQGFTLGQSGDAQYNIPAVANGTDVTGRGHPNMIVSAYTGGAHCCTSHLVFELQPAFRLLATLNDADDDLAHFERDPVDHHYYYVTADWTFAYWPSCFACSPSAIVKLRYVDDAKGGGFHLAMDKMQKPAPSAAKWNQELSTAKKAAATGGVNDIGTALWGPVLSLIYQGHSELAWKFVADAGPKAVQKPLPSLADFCSVLKKSPYWGDLKGTLRNPPAECGP